MIEYLQGDCKEVLKTLPEKSVHCCVTSPPYWGLRDYGTEGQLGQEDTPEEFVDNLCNVFNEVKRVLRDDGTLWLNLGDSYCGTGSKGDLTDPKHPEGRNGQKIAINNKIQGLKSKDLVGIPWRMAFELQRRGWYLRQDIIWHKPNPMPKSVQDRCTKSHEYIFLLSKSKKYYFDAESIQEKANPDNSIRDRDNTRLNNTPGRSKMGGLTTNHYETRNKRSVWTVNTQPYKGAHFAVFPPDLIRPCIQAGCPDRGIVLDPFGGSGTTAMVAEQEGKNSILIELNKDYISLQKKRTQQRSLFS